MSQPPAFQFYADDFLSGTADMTAEEVGVYIRLLCHQHTKGGLDPTRLHIMAGNEPTTNQALTYVRTKFEACDDGMLRNRKMEKVRAESVEWREKSSKGGQHSASKRVGSSEWGKMMASKRTNNEPTTNHNNEPLTNSPSPSPYIPTMEDCQKWLADWVKNGADYTVKEMEGAELALRASGWMWGKNPVTDFRAALERQIQTDRQRNQKPNYANTNRNSAGRPDRNKGTLNEGQSAKFAAFTERQKSANAKA